VNNVETFAVKIFNHKERKGSTKGTKSMNRQVLKQNFMNSIYRIIFICILLLFAGRSMAQTGNEDKSLKYFNKTEAGISFGLGTFKTDVYNGIQRKVRNDEIVVTLQTINGFKYMNRLSLGVSVGAELWQNGLFWPIYGYLGYDFKPMGDNNFFADVYIGYAPGKRDSTSFYHYEGTGAFALSIGVGYKMKVTKNIRFIYEVFYKYQALESSYNNIVEYGKNDSTYYHSAKVDYKIPLSFAGFKIGICFP
jgi:hypothetical protein